MTYLIDADVLIEAKDRHYAFDFCPGFWDWILQQHALKVVFSVKAVGDELKAGNDQLAAWATKQGSKFFLPEDGNTVASMAVVATTAATMTVNKQLYTPAALNQFMSSGDYRLISHAKAHGHTVVTHEVGQKGSNQPSLKRLKIPDVCHAVGVTCISPFKLLRDEGARLVV